jgi:threonine dehydratase
MPTSPTYQDVAAAAARLLGHAHRTPVLRSTTADQRLGAQLHFKCENLQRMGAFKFRGAFNALSRFSDEQRRGGVLAFSSGNHAQAIALSARLLKMPAAILMPLDAPVSKVEATRGYGAEVIQFDRYTQDREALAASLAKERGMTLIPPYDHPDVIAGQGTAAKELFDEAGEDGQQSFRAGRIIDIPTPKTIADGAQTQHLGNYTFEVIRRDVDDIFTVSDDQLVDAMRFFAERMKMIVEPTGCLSYAGAIHSGLDLKGKRVGVIVSGGNVDLQRFASLVG